MANSGVYVYKSGLFSAFAHNHEIDALYSRPSLTKSDQDASVALHVAFGSSASATLKYRKAGGSVKVKDEVKTYSDIWLRQH